MDILIGIGAFVSLIGLVGIVLSAVMVVRARKSAAGDDAALRARMNKILPLNLGALFLSVIGLMMVVVGVLLA